MVLPRLKDSTLVVQKQSFVNARARASPTAAMGTAIFFVQSFGLIAKDASFFGIGEFFNLDAEEATGRCLSPFSYSERYLAKTLLIPASICVGVYVAVPIWNWLRNSSLLKERMESPQAIERIHVRRALVYAFLFCFAPLTRSSVEALVCVKTCSDDSAECGLRLMTDMAERCYTGEHLFVAPLAILVLLSVMILIPGALLYHVYHSRRKRDFSLKLRASDVDRWFKEIDEDSSGFLDETEMKYLLECMGEATDKHTLKKVMLEMDPDNSGHVSKRQFEDTQCLLHVRNIGPARCKTEELLAQIFGRFGNVAFSTIRDRVDATNGQDTSWAVVQMADASSAGKALTVASESGGIVGLDGVTRLNVTQFSNSTANASTGGMRGMIGGQVSKSQFETWYHDQLTHLIGTPFDVLFCTTNSNAYWW